MAKSLSRLDIPDAKRVPIYTTSITLPQYQALPSLHSRSGQMGINSCICEDDWESPSKRQWDGDSQM